MQIPLQPKARQRILLKLKQPLKIIPLKTALHRELARDLDERICGRLLVHQFSSTLLCYRLEPGMTVIEYIVPRINIAACISSTSRPMHRSSTPMKGSGLSPNVHSPIAAPMIWRSWSKTSSTRSTMYGAQGRSCAAASCNLTCLLFCVRILHYLCRYQ